MDQMIFLLVSFLFLFPGHQSSNEFTTNGTVYYNVTGTICTRVENVRDIVDRESDVYTGIARNLTRGFGRFFPNRVHWLDYKVTVKKLFIWPTAFLGEYENAHNLSFVIIAQHKFQTTPEKKVPAELYFRTTFWGHVGPQIDDEGYITSEGLRIGYEDPIKLPDQVMYNLSLPNGYMAFITKFKNSNNGGSVPTKTTNGNSSAQGSYNSSVKVSASSARPEISYIAYIGITLSMIGLFITMTTICYFRRIRKFRRNQILIHICATVMAGMLLSIISFTYKGDKRICTAIAQLLHYFILAALSWMCVEAYNLYRDLVKVFNTNVVSSRVFTLRACIFGYGLPAVIVGITSVVDISVYGRRNDACWMTSLAFLVSFLAPVLLIVSVNIVFFSLIMREIIQVSQRDENNIRPSLRAAVSLSVVFGFCWLFAGISTFTTNPFVTYVFVIMSSFQGLFIFIFHGIGKQELRDSWKSLRIFNWQFNKFTNTESQGRGKTDSTTQDSPQALKPFSADKAGKPSEEYILGFDAGCRSACDAGYNQAYLQEHGPSTKHSIPYSIPNVPEMEHGPVKKTESNC